MSIGFRTKNITPNLSVLARKARRIRKSAYEKKEIPPKPLSRNSYSRGYMKTCNALLPILWRKFHGVSIQMNYFGITFLKYYLFVSNSGNKVICIAPLNFDCEYPAWQLQG